MFYYQNIVKTQCETTFIEHFLWLLLQVRSKLGGFQLEEQTLLNKQYITVNLVCTSHKLNTVLSAINGHSKKRKTLVSGRFYFLRRNSGQTHKNFLKNRQVISGHSVQRALFSARTGLFTFFFLQLADTINNFEVILAAREEEYKKRFAECFLNVIYYRH